MVLTKKWERGDKIGAVTDEEKAPLLLLLEKWKRERAAAQRVVDEKNVAIFHLEQSLAGNSTPTLPTLHGLRTPRTAKPPPLPKPPRPPGLTAHTRAALREATSEEVTIPAIYAAMVAKGVQFNAKDPKLRMNKVFERLVQLGALERTATGVGNAPNRYRKTERFSEIVISDSQNEEGGDA